MKNIIAILVSLIMVATVFVACSSVANKSEIPLTTQAQRYSETTQAPTELDGRYTYNDYVIMSFNAVEGAVIYDQRYDSNGYLESCQYHCKWEACGYVSNTNGQARDNMHTSYHCTQCGNDQRVEITADHEWVEISNGY